MLTISSTTLTFESSRKPCCTVPMPSVPAADERGVGVVVEGGKAVFERLDVHELGSAWEREEGR